MKKERNKRTGMKVAATVSAVTLMALVHDTDWSCAETREFNTQSMDSYEHARSDNSREDVQSDNSYDGSRSENSSRSENIREENVITLTVSADNLRYTSGKVGIYIDIKDSLNKGIKKLEYIREGSERNGVRERRIENYENGGIRRSEIEVMENGIYTVRAMDADEQTVEEKIEIKSIIKKQKSKATDSLKYKGDFSPEKVEPSKLPSFTENKRSEKNIAYLTDNKKRQGKIDYRHNNEKLKYPLNGLSGNISEGIDMKFEKTEEEKPFGFYAIEDREALKEVRKLFADNTEEDENNPVYDVLGKRLKREEKNENLKKGGVAAGIAVFLTGLYMTHVLHLIHKVTKH